jgi:hypothetical protein
MYWHALIGDDFHVLVTPGIGYGTALPPRR